MIKSIFPIHVLIKDFDMPPEWNSAIELAVKTYFIKVLADTGQDRATLSGIPMELFSEENMSVTPELRELRKMFIDGFYELYMSYDKKRYETIYGEKLLSYENIETMASNDLGRVPFMKNGDCKRLHNHTKAEVYGIFYLNDINNNRDGGKLILYDPSFHSLVDFYESNVFEIETKKNRMIIAPAHIWHEVTQYIGDEERITIVLNLEYA